MKVTTSIKSSAKMMYAQDMRAKRVYICGELTLLCLSTTVTKGRITCLDLKEMTCRYIDIGTPVRPLDPGTTITIVVEQ
jgi:hypothetical protein